jgi:hypothetical protein
MAQAPLFRQPIDGIYKKDFFIVNYVDHDTSTDIKDPECGQHTYDGHTGTDFVLRSFPQMDSGVIVRAAAAGTVIYVSDTAFDRNKTVNLLGFGNYVAIAHAGNTNSYYAHLKKNSARVKVGDKVEAGDALGLVGSSGNSTDPHLHFEVWTDSTLRDPFSGKCSSSKSYWAEQLPYNTEFGVIDYGMVSFLPTLDTLRERPTKQTNFASPDSVIGLWTHIYGLQAGDSTTVEWFTPQDSLWFRYSFYHPYGSEYYYWYSYILRPLILPGTWTVRFSINKQPKFEQKFTISTSTAVSESNEKSSFEMPSDADMTVVDVCGRILWQGKYRQSMPALADGFYIARCSWNNHFVVYSILSDGGTTSIINHISTR